MLQNVFGKGLSQFDDIMHNSVGCVFNAYVGPLSVPIPSEIL